MSELVERANQGEDVLITVRGKIRARLTKAGPEGSTRAGAEWAQELHELQQSVRARRKPRLSTDDILSQDREDRT
jgi:antitoxin (DNA-binding transcriptional repressor) of toxin-antitoxin stability system